MVISLNFEKILMTISSILTDNPIINEPGFDKIQPNSVQGLSYSNGARYLTLISTIRNIKDERNEFHSEMVSYFRNNYQVYLDSISKLVHEPVQNLHHNFIVYPDVVKQLYSEYKLIIDQLPLPESTKEVKDEEKKEIEPQREKSPKKVKNKESQKDKSPKKVKNKKSSKKETKPLEEELDDIQLVD